MEPDRPTAWITGARGLIGYHLAQQAPAALPGWRIIPLGRDDLDLLDSRAVASRFAADQPGIMLHCAALSRSPACQENPALARALNVDLPRRLAELGAGGRMVFFSTDLVFDGRAGNYTEADSPNPLMVYGETKVEAERLVLQNPANLVIRTSINAGRSPTGNRGFDEEMCHAWRAGRTVQLFTDEFRTPIMARETARVVLELVQAGVRGLYHVSGGEPLSRWAIGQRLAARHPELNPRIEPSSIRDHPGSPRPADVTLNCAKAESMLHRPMPQWGKEEG